MPISVALVWYVAALYIRCATGVPFNDSNN